MNLQAAGFAYLVQFAYVEGAHRDFLTAALGGLYTNGGAAHPLQGPTKTYSMPALNAAATLSDILAAILPLEETGVRAYLGAGKYLQDNNTVQTAVAIYSTECRHSASIEYILAANGTSAAVPADGTIVGPHNSIPGVPAGEIEVAAAPSVLTNPPAGTTYVRSAVFEKALPPANVLLGASAFLA